MITDILRELHSIQSRLNRLAAAEALVKEMLENKTINIDWGSTQQVLINVRDLERLLECLAI